MGIRLNTLGICWARPCTMVVNPFVIASPSTEENFFIFVPMGAL